MISEGPGNATDWHDIKAATSCFFMPDWSSLGARDALALAGGVSDGLFSWVCKHLARKAQSTDMQERMHGRADPETSTLIPTPLTLIF